MTRAQRFHDAIHRGIATRLLLLTVGFLIAGASAALAYWTISTVYAPTSYAIAQANSLSAPSAPTATETGATAITVGWTLPATQLTGAQYKVTRNSGPGSGTVVCAVASNITSCQDMALSSATAYGYTVKAVIGTNWQSSPIAASATTIGVTTTSLTNGVVGSAYSGTLTAIGGTGTYTHWALSSGTLPSGATLNTSTGTISGTPNAAATTSGLQFTVTDSLGYTATSGSLSLTVSQASTTTSLSLSASSVVYGNEQTITFTSTVAPQFSGTATGTVAVKSGVTTLCTITLPATTCSTPATALTVSGSAYSVTAVYSGDTNFTTSTSTSQSLTVTKDSTTTTVSESPTSVAYGNEASVTFTAGVTTTYGEAVPASDTINVSVNSGAATCTVTLPATTCTIANTALPVGGPYTVTAIYNADTNLTTSTATSATSLTVTKASTTTSLSLSASSVVYGNEQTITFTSTVAPQFSGTATGTVAVKSGVTTLCTITLPATTCSTPATALTVSGSAYSVTAVYSGDTNFTTSTSTSQSLTVTKASTTTSLSLSASSVVYGNEQTVTFTSTVAPQFSGTATGTVAVKSGVTTLCTITLPASTCTTTSTALTVSGGAYSVTAVYSGDTNFTTSTSTGHNLTVSQASTTTSLSLSASSVVYGNEQTITFTSTVAPQFSGTATGTVAVKSGVTTLCTITLPASTCTTTSTALTVSGGAYSVTAVYSGDTNFTTSTSTSQSLTVTKASQIINFTSTAPTTASVGDTYTPTATASSGLTVALTIDSSSSSVCSISAGTVTYTTSGTCTIDANQSGGSNYNAAAQVQQAFNVSPGQLVITNGAVSGAASATPNLGPITVERRNAGGTPTAIGNLTVALASNSATKSFGTGQFGATVTTVTIPNGSSSVTFWYGDQTVGSPTVTASATGYGAGIQIETITTAPVGLGIVITGGTGTPALVCGPVASSYTCNITGVGSGGSATFYVTFWNGSKSQVVYSSTQSSTVFESGQNVGNVIIAATASSSNPSFLTASHTGATKTSTLTFGPYTLIISVNN
jgi:hypothetical protein